MTTMNTVVKGIEVDHISGAIVVTKAFLKLAKNPSTDEFTLLINTRKECPTYTIVERKIDTNDSKESYGGLSIEKMLAYIHVFDKDKLVDFENAIRVYSNKDGKIQKGKYATIKKIFLHKCKDGYNALSIDNMVKVDEKEKELKEKANGIIKNVLNPAKITEFPTPQKEAVGQ